MTYTVSVRWSDGTTTHHDGLSRAVAQAFADHIAATYAFAQIDIRKDGAR